MDQPDPTTQIAGLIASKFIERRDAKAIQTKSGAYMPVRVDMKDSDSELIPWSMDDLKDHVLGNKTYGHYLVSREGNCRVIVFDLDLRAKANIDRGEEPIMFEGEEIDPRKVWVEGDSPCKRSLALQLRVMAEALANRAKKLLDVPVMVSYSGSKGMHVYACLDRGTPAADAREATALIIESTGGLIVPDRGKNFFKHAEHFKAVSIEVFPKQDDVGKEGFGNLVRLPLGKNLKTGGRGFFLNMNTPQDKFAIDDPIEALTYGSLR